MALIIGNLIVGNSVVSSSKPVTEIETISFSQLKKDTEFDTKQIQEETHIKLQDGELERLIPKKSSYMMDFTSGSE